MKNSQKCSQDTIECIVEHELEILLINNSKPIIENLEYEELECDMSFGIPIPLDYKVSIYEHICKKCNHLKGKSRFVSVKNIKHKDSAFFTVAVDKIVDQDLSYLKMITNDMYHISKDMVLEHILCGRKVIKKNNGIFVSLPVDKFGQFNELKINNSFGNKTFSFPKLNKNDVAVFMYNGNIFKLSK